MANNYLTNMGKNGSPNFMNSKAGSIKSAQKIPQRTEINIPPRVLRKRNHTKAAQGTISHGNVSMNEEEVALRLISSETMAKIESLKQFEFSVFVRLRSDITKAVENHDDKMLANLFDQVCLKWVTAHTDWENLLDTLEQSQNKYRELETENMGLKIKTQEEQLK